MDLEISESFDNIQFWDCRPPVTGKIGLRQDWLQVDAWVPSLPYIIMKCLDTGEYYLKCFWLSMVPRMLAAR
jgi:hypothetical protein